MNKLKEYIRSINDFPKEGIIFRDITSLLADSEGLVLAIDSLKKEIENLDYDLIIGPESRGFIFGVPLAYACKKPFIPIRKKGKLPLETYSIEYDLEYGSAILEMHRDAIKEGQKVVIVDDLLATGGTTKAMIDLIKKAGAEIVKICFVIELEELKGREKLKEYEVKSLVKY